MLCTIYIVSLLSVRRRRVFSFLSFKYLRCHLFRRGNFFLRQCCPRYFNLICTSRIYITRWSSPFRGAHDVKSSLRIIFTSRGQSQIPPLWKPSKGNTTSAIVSKDKLLRLLLLSSSCNGTKPYTTEEKKQILCFLKCRFSLLSALCFLLTLTLHPPPLAH